MIQIELYSSLYKEDLKQLLKNVSEELYGTGKVDFNAFIDEHWAVYLVVDTSKSLIVGFSAYILNHYFGMRAPTLANTYLYLLPEYRGSRAMYLLSLQSGKISQQYDLDLEHYYASEHSIKLSSKLKGAKIFEAYVYPKEEVARVFNKMKSKSTKREYK